MHAVRQAVEDGRIDALEAEQLTGYLMLAGRMHVSERTARRRRARLQELGIPLQADDDEQLAWVLSEQLRSGDITEDQAVAIAGQYMLRKYAQPRDERA